MSDLAGRLVFGIGGNAEPYQIEGWSLPEDGFAWSTGEQSRVRLRAPPGEGAMALEISLVPLLHPSVLLQQRLRIAVNGVVLANEIVAGPATLAVPVPAHAIAASDELIVTLFHPDAQSPTNLGVNRDPRRLGFMVREISLVRMAYEAAFLPRTLAPLPITTPDDAAALVHARTGLDLIDLLAQFESLGHNCEFGLMQRALGAEPLGLLRFGGLQPENLLPGLEHAFEGINDPQAMQVTTGMVNGREEYLIRDGRYAVDLHTNQFGGDVTAERLIAKMVPHLAFLQRLFAETLRDASRIFVLHHPVFHNSSRVLPILNRLQQHGPNSLLYITEHPTVPPGTLVQEQPNLFHGYTDFLPPMHEGDKSNLGAWISLCANAYRLWRVPSGGAGV